MWNVSFSEVILVTLAMDNIIRHHHSTSSVEFYISGSHNSYGYTFSRTESKFVSSWRPGFPVLIGQYQIQFCQCQYSHCL